MTIKSGYTSSSSKVYKILSIFKEDKKNLGASPKKSDQFFSSTQPGVENLKISLIIKSTHSL